MGYEIRSNREYEYRLDYGMAEITKYKGVGGPVDIPYSIDGFIVKKICSSAFSRCDKLTSVTIAGNVMEIDSYAFSHCDNLTSVTIAGNVKKINSSLLSGCDNLTSVTLGDSVMDVSEYAFNQLKKLRRISVSPGNSCLADINGVLFNKPERRLVCYPAGLDSKEYSIPEGIRVIGNLAFSFCHKLTSIKIPNSVTSIGDWAFAACTSLTSIDISDSITSIGNHAFHGCPMTFIKIPDTVTNVGDNPFVGCSKLMTISVSPEHGYLEYINNVLFSKPDRRLVYYPIACKNTEYSIPEGTRIIGDSAFESNECITVVMVPGSAKRIDANAFSSCHNLTSIVIPDGVEEIGNYAFSYCRNLTYVTIPMSVTRIGDDAFSKCGDGLMIIAEEGSYARDYCRKFGYAVGCISTNNNIQPAIPDWLKE